MSRIFRENLGVPDAKADIYVVGLGVGGFDRRTVEADDVLASCALIAHLTAFDAELKAKYAADVMDLRTIYRQGRDPKTVYHEIVVAILRAASTYKRHGPVCFVVYGNPLFLVDSSWELRESCAADGLTLKVIPGLSFVDQILDDLGVRFDFACQVYESRLFYEEEVRPNIRYPLILSQYGDFGSSQLMPQGSQISRLETLVLQLKALYPTERRVAIVFSAWRSDMAPQVAMATIGDLASLSSRAHVGVTLYVEGEGKWSGIFPR